MSIICPRSGNLHTPPRDVANPEWYADNALMHSGVLFMTRTQPKIHHFGLAGFAAALAAVLAGCATLPPPIQLMDRAQSEIHAARNAGAETAAPEALAEAERRLAAAQQFSASSDNGKATEKAQEAEAAAATARTRAEVAGLDQKIQQQTSVNVDLQADLQRRQRQRRRRLATRRWICPPSSSISRVRLHVRPAPPCLCLAAPQALRTRG